MAMGLGLHVMVDIKQFVYVLINKIPVPFAVILLSKTEFSLLLVSSEALLN